jgi:hypothetical protein
VTSASAYGARGGWSGSGQGRWATWLRGKDGTEWRSPRLVDEVLSTGNHLERRRNGGRRYQCGRPSMRLTHITKHAVVLVMARWQRRLMSGIAGRIDMANRGFTKRSYAGGRRRERLD